MTDSDQQTDEQTGQDELSTSDLVSAGNAAGDSSNEGSQNQPAALFDQAELAGFRDRWRDVQASFVDDPRQAVQQADNLVATVIKQLAESFAQERKNLEGQWEQGGDVSTEDLRVALQRYRSFFDRLLSL